MTVSIVFVQLGGIYGRDVIRCGCTAQQPDALVYCPPDAVHVLHTADNYYAIPIFSSCPPFLIGSTLLSLPLGHRRYLYLVYKR